MRVMSVFLCLAAAAVAAAQTSSVELLREARALSQAGDPEQAIALYEQVLQAAASELPPRSTAYPKLLREVAKVYAGQGRSVAAEQLYRRALTAAEGVYGATGRELLPTIDELAELYAGQGRATEAEALDRRAREIRSRHALAPPPARRQLSPPGLAVPVEPLPPPSAESAPHPEPEPKPPLEPPPEPEPPTELEPPPEPPLAATPEPPAPVGEDAGGWTASYRVQVAAMHEREAAAEHLAALERSLPELLAETPSRIERADLGERGVWYRIQFGGLPDLEAARRLCAELTHRAGSECLVIAP